MILKRTDPTGKGAMKRRGFAKLTCSLAVVGLVALPLAASAQAEEAEPAVASSAWYWKTQKSQPIVNPVDGSTVAVIEQPNPFCPGAASAGTRDEICRAGRLPIEVQNGDYTEPDKVSAIGFDLTLVPLGSDVSKFTVELLEANDPQSEPINADGHGLKACVVSQFFGDGEAREYKERPRFECTKTDPIAERKAFKFKTADGTEDRFRYVFDLTEFAKGWVEDGAAVTAVILYPVPVDPKGDKDPQRDNAWRTVLTGAAEPDGVKTNLVYKAPPTPVITPLPPTEPVDPGTGFGSGSTDDFSTGTTDTGSTDTFGTGTADAPTGGGTEVPAEDSAGDPEAVVPLEDPALAGGEVPKGPGIPGYVWLAVLAGMMAFSLVRQVVLESAAGIRPDGVLSQIRKINTERRGGAIAETTGIAGKAGLSSAFKEFGSGLKEISFGLGSLASKLPFKGKG